MNIYFDVDYTILSAQHTLRPDTKEVFTKLVEDGHAVYIWSGMGLRWSVVNQFELTPLVSGVFSKPITDYLEGLVQFEVSPFPDFVIDDYPGIVEAFGGMYIREYFHPDAEDDQIMQCYEIITEVAASGESSHPRWRRRVTEAVGE